MIRKKYTECELAEFHGDHISLHSTKRNHNEGHYTDETSLHVHVEAHGESQKQLRKSRITPYDYNDLWKVFIVETVANIVFILIENYTQGKINISIFGLCLMFMILYPVSGANTNAYVSFALWFYEEEFNKIHTIRRFSYILLFQPLGMFIGQMISLGVIGPNIIYLVPKDTEPFKIAFCEFLWTGGLIFVALHVIVSRYTRPTNQIGINFIIFAVFLYFITQAGHTISGSSYNPTKYLVNQAIAYHRGIEQNAFKNWYCYIFPQLIGNVSFTMAFKHFFEPLYYRMLTLKYKWEDGFFPEKYEKEN